MLVPILIAVILGYLTYKLNARPTNFPNGPWNLPIVGYLPFLGRYPHLTFRDLSKKYGDIFSVNMGGYRAVVLSSYEMIRDALKEESFTGRPILAFFQLRSEDKGLIFSNGHTWQETRRFTLRNLRDFGLGKTSLERVVQEEIRELIETHKRTAGKPVRLHNTFNLAVVNALWTITAGQRFDLDDPKAIAFVNQLNKSINEGTNFTQLVPIVVKLKGFSANLRAFLNTSKSRYLTIIREHQRVHKEGDQSDFIHVFLDKRQEDEKKGKSTPFTGEEGIRNLMVTTMDLFTAGSETTSTTLLWVFLLLATRPDVQDKLQHELDSVVGKERLPSMDDKPSMPYTEAVLTECQRFASLAPLSVSHATTADTQFKGYTIPKGTIVIPNLYQVMRDPSIWEKPEEFYPEHFLTEDGQVKNVEQHIPFSTGKRLCLGEGLARMELFLFATALLQQFKFTFPVDQPKPTLVPPPNAFLAPAPFDIILTLRT